MARGLEPVWITGECWQNGCFVFEFPTTKSQQQQVMLARGVPARAFRDEVKVLGVRFQNHRGGVSSSVEQRHTDAKSVLSRVDMLPFPGPFRAQVYRSRVSPYLVWGHWLPEVDHPAQLGLSGACCRDTGLTLLSSPVLMR